MPLRQRKKIQELLRARGVAAFQMSSQPRAKYFKTAEQYLAAERVAEQKHEYLASVIYD